MPAGKHRVDFSQLQQVNVFPLDAFAVQALYTGLNHMLRQMLREKNELRLNTRHVEVNNFLDRF
jgi:hypothetical protein